MRLNVNIGGDIEVQKSTYSTNNPDTHQTLFAANFSLTSKGNSLDDALLVANVRHGATVVARNLGVSNHAGSYEVSWTGPHKLAPGGHYTWDVYRQVDADRPRVEPLFSIEFDHEGVATTDFGVAPELLLVGALGVAFFFVSQTLSKLK